MFGREQRQQAVPSTKYSVLSTQRLPLLFLGLALLMFTGCGPAADRTSAPSSAATNVSNAALVRADSKLLDETIAKHKGKVVLVDYWATWCLPCVEGFPHTVELAKKYREQGLATIALSLDLLEEERKVQEFLNQQRADFDCLISKHNAIGQKPAEDFGVEALPQYRLYDRQGKLRKKWEGTPDNIEREIETLLAEQA
jgi:thiol-disulfide isomerase/thioredoxin